MRVDGCRELEDEMGQSGVGTTDAQPRGLRAWHGMKDME